MDSVTKQKLENEPNGRGTIKSDIPLASLNETASKHAATTEASEKRVAANRANALKSTGPKTADGKAASSQNARKHGMLSESPVIVGLESQEEWEQHLEGILESLQPVGYLETMFATKIATESWKMGRSVRYQAKYAAGSITSEGEFAGGTEASNRRRQSIEDGLKIIDLLDALPTLDDELHLDKDIASLTLWALWEEVAEGHDKIVVPGIPQGDAAFDDFDRWTPALLKKAIKVFAGTAQVTQDQLREQCIRAVHEKRLESIEEERTRKEKLERKRHSRAMLNPRMLTAIARYETGCERSLFKNLHALERLQAERRGRIVSPPEAIDLDLTVREVNVPQSDFLDEAQTESFTPDVPGKEVINTAMDASPREGNRSIQNQVQDQSQAPSEKCETNPLNWVRTSVSDGDTEDGDCETQDLAHSSLAAARSGAVVPPPAALDVDLTIHQEPSDRFHSFVIL